MKMVNFSVHTLTLLSTACMTLQKQVSASEANSKKVENSPSAADPARNTRHIPPGYYGPALLPDHDDFPYFSDQYPYDVSRRRNPWTSLLTGEIDETVEDGRFNPRYRTRNKASRSRRPGSARDRGHAVVREYSRVEELPPRGRKPFRNSEYTISVTNFDPRDRGDYGGYRGGGGVRRPYAFDSQQSSRLEPEDYSREDSARDRAQQYPRLGEEDVGLENLPDDDTQNANSYPEFSWDGIPPLDTPMCSDRHSCSDQVWQWADTRASRSWLDRGCMCDDSCISYGDCCRDADIATDNVTSLVSRILTGPFSCRPVTQISFSLPFQEEASVVQYYMRDSCPSQASEALRTPCERPNAVSDDPLSAVPVTSLDSGVTYSNYACAICNSDVSRVSLWRMLVRCDGVAGGIGTAQEIAESLRPTRDGGWGVPVTSGGVASCTIVAQPPEGVQPRQCLDMEDTCPRGTAEDLAEMCANHTAVVYHGGRAFRNIYCLLCNVPESPDPPLCTAPCARPEVPLSSGTLRVRLTLQQGDSLRCGDGEVWDPFLRRRLCWSGGCDGSGISVRRTAQDRSRCVDGEAFVITTAAPPPKLPATPPVLDAGPGIEAPIPDVNVDVPGDALQNIRSSLTQNHARLVANRDALIANRDRLIQNQDTSGDNFERRVLIDKRIDLVNVRNSLLREREVLLGEKSLILERERKAALESNNFEFNTDTGDQSTAKIGQTPNDADRSSGTFLDVAIPVQSSVEKPSSDLSLEIDRSPEMEHHTHTQLNLDGLAHATDGNHLQDNVAESFDEEIDYYDVDDINDFLVTNDVGFNAKNKDAAPTASNNLINTGRRRGKSFDTDVDRLEQPKDDIQDKSDRSNSKNDDNSVRIKIDSSNEAARNFFQLENEESGNQLPNNRIIFPNEFESRPDISDPPPRQDLPEDGSLLLNIRQNRRRERTRNRIPGLRDRGTFFDVTQFSEQEGGGNGVFDDPESPVDESKSAEEKNIAVNTRFRQGSSQSRLNSLDVRPNRRRFRGRTRNRISVGSNRVRIPDRRRFEPRYEQDEFADNADKAVEDVEPVEPRNESEDEEEIYEDIPDNEIDRTRISPTGGRQSPFFEVPAGPRRTVRPFTRFRNRVNDERLRPEDVASDRAGADTKNLQAEQNDSRGRARFRPQEPEAELSSVEYPRSPDDRDIFRGNVKFSGRDPQSGRSSRRFSQRRGGRLPLAEPAGTQRNLAESDLTDALNPEFPPQYDYDYEYEDGAYSDDVRTNVPEESSTQSENTRAPAVVYPGENDRPTVPRRRPFSSTGSTRSSTRRTLPFRRRSQVSSRDSLGPAEAEDETLGIRRQNYVSPLLRRRTKTRQRQTTA